MLLSLHISNEAAGGIFVLATSSTGQIHCRTSRTSKMFDVVSATLAPLPPALAWVLNVSHRVVGQWPTYRRNRRSGTSGWCTGAGGPCYVLRRVRRSTQLRRRRPAMPCRVRTQDGPVGLVKRLEGGGRMNGATMEPGYTLILQASSRQLPHVRVRIPKPPPRPRALSRSLFWNSAPSSSPEDFLSLKATHT